MCSCPKVQDKAETWQGNGPCGFQHPWQTLLPSARVRRMPSLGWGPALGVGDAVVVCVCHGGKCVNGTNLAVKTQGQHSPSLTTGLSRHPATTRSFFRAVVLAEARGSVGGQFPVTPPGTAVLPGSAIGCPQPGAGAGQRLNSCPATLGHTAWSILTQADSSSHPQHDRRLELASHLEVKVSGFLG